MLAKVKMMVKVDGQMRRKTRGCSATDLTLVSRARGRAFNPPAGRFLSGLEVRGPRGNPVQQAIASRSCCDLVKKIPSAHDIPARFATDEL